MKLQCVTVSVNYSDFLVHTLKSNHILFDKWVIVTDKKDHATKELCEQYPNVICIQTNVFYEQGAKFNKYAGINVGLELIDDDAWVLFLDSDIVLHYETARVLRELHLDKSFLYGVDRLNCEGAERYEQFKGSNSLLKENWLLTNAGLELGARLVHYYGHEGENGRFEGWRPLGFFQLCHRSAFNLYPQETMGADHCDLLFAREWPRSRRANIPELLVVHLESIHANKGVNWYGRRSQPFKLPEPVQEVIDGIEQEEKLIESVILGLILKSIRKMRHYLKLLIAVLKKLCEPKINHYYGK